MPDLTRLLDAVDEDLEAAAEIFPPVAVELRKLAARMLASE